MYNVRPFENSADIFLLQTKYIDWSIYKWLI